MFFQKVEKVQIKVEFLDRGRVVSEEVIDQVTVYMRQSYKILEGRSKKKLRLFNKCLISIQSMCCLLEMVSFFFSKKDRVYYRGVYWLWRRQVLRKESQRYT